MKSAKDPQEQQKLKSLPGKVAIANGKLAYQRYLNIFSGPQWDKLRSKGAQTQRVLWASTSTKNPAYPDILYVQEMIGPDTVNTLPPATLEAFKDHGRVTRTIDSPEALVGEINTLTRSEIAAVADSATAMLGAKTFAEAVEVNLGYARRSFDALIGSTAKLSEIGVKTAADASRPIVTRFGSGWKAMHFG